MTDHRTPLPWHRDRSGSGYYKFVIRGPQDHYIGRIERGHGDAVGEANLAFILRAVNAHDALVAALKMARPIVDRDSGNDGDVAQIDAALAKAEAGV
jgi:hypothetical protein